MSRDQVIPKMEAIRDEAVGNRHRPIEWHVGGTVYNYLVRLAFMEPDLPAHVGLWPQIRVAGIPVVRNNNYHPRAIQLVWENMNDREESNKTPSSGLSAGDRESHPSEGGAIRERTRSDYINYAERARPDFGT